MNQQKKFTGFDFNRIRANLDVSTIFNTEALKKESNPLTRSIVCKKHHANINMNDYAYAKMVLETFSASFQTYNNFSFERLPSCLKNGIMGNIMKGRNKMDRNANSRIFEKNDKSLIDGNKYDYAVR